MSTWRSALSPKRIILSRHSDFTGGARRGAPGEGQPMSFQNIRIRCITHPASKILQSTGNPVISPGRPPMFCSLAQILVSGLTIVALASSAFRPSFFPILASCRRSSSLSRTWPLIFDRRMRFSVMRYSFRSRSSSSTEQIT